MLAGRFSREITHPPDQVRAALLDLDIRRQPGNPGSDPARAGGVAPVFQVAHSGDAIVWTVMSNDRVATRMTAYLEPIDGGRATRVTAEVERGDAPDALVSPAFRSESLTYALFTSALGDELDEMLAPPRASAQACEALRARLANQSGGPGRIVFDDPAVETAQSVVRNIRDWRRSEVALREAGCTDTGRRAGDPFPPISNRMGSPAAR
jgi:hypothetical protein